MRQKPWISCCWEHGSSFAMIPWIWCSHGYPEPWIDTRQQTAGTWNLSCASGERSSCRCSRIDSRAWSINPNWLMVRKMVPWINQYQPRMIPIVISWYIVISRDICYRMRLCMCCCLQCLWHHILLHFAAEHVRSPLLEAVAMGKCRWTSTLFFWTSAAREEIDGNLHGNLQPPEICHVLLKYIDISIHFQWKYS